MRKPPVELARHHAFVLRVSIGVEQANGDGLRIELRKRVEIEWLQDTVGPRSLAHAHATIERHERFRLLDAQPIEVRTRLSPELQDVLESGGRHESRSGPLPLEQRVRRDRRAVREALDGLRPGHARSRNDGLLLPRRREHLRRRQASVGEEHRVRERPTDVDTEKGHSGRLTA